MSRDRFEILITNDDGFEAEGLKALRDALDSTINIKIVAPAIEKSACSHSLTLTRPLHFIEIEKDFYKLDDGTPSDCIFLALTKLYKDKKPNLIISGINRGANMGEDITYSGTVGGAMEGVIQGVPSIAISQVCGGSCVEMNKKIDYQLAQKVIVEVVEKVKKDNFPLGRRKLLNINVPPINLEDSKGLRVTYAGERVYGNDVSTHINPRGKEYFWIGLPVLDWIDNPKDGLISDFEAIDKNFVSITPIHLDMTSYNDINRLKGWF